MTTLAVLGAGVKAVAVAAKAHVLREMGVGAPDVVAIERLGVGANWQASGGWTDGAQRLEPDDRQVSHHQELTASK